MILKIRSCHNILNNIWSSFLIIFDHHFLSTFPAVFNLITTLHRSGPRGLQHIIFHMDFIFAQELEHPDHAGWTWLNLVELGGTWFSWYFIFNMIRSTSITRWKYFSYWLCVFPFQISCTAAWRPTAGCLQWFTGKLLCFNNHDNVNFFVGLDFLLLWSGSQVIFNKGSLKESSQELCT